METGKQIFWNSIHPVADQGGSIIPGTGIKAGQEVIYSKVIRKMMGFDRKSWMELVMFSLVTAVTDEGMGSWYGVHKTSKQVGFMDVLKEAIRPLLSVLSVNYIFNVSYQGFHNPMRTFSFMDFLISLAAKDMALGGNAILAQNVTSAADFIGRYENARERAQIASRFQRSG